MIVNNMCIVIFPSLASRQQNGLSAGFSVWVIGWTMTTVKGQAFFFTVGALIGIFVSTLSPGKPSSEDSKLSRPFMGRQASWLSELSTSTTAGKRD